MSFQFLFSELAKNIHVMFYEGQEKLKLSSAREIWSNEIFKKHFLFKIAR